MATPTPAELTRQLLLLSRIPGILTKHGLDMEAPIGEIIVTLDEKIQAAKATPKGRAQADLTRALRKLDRMRNRKAAAERRADKAEAELQAAKAKISTLQQDYAQLQSDKAAADRALRMAKTHADNPAHGLRAASQILSALAEHPKGIRVETDVETETIGYSPETWGPIQRLTAGRNLTITSHA